MFLNKLLTTVCQGDGDTLKRHNTEKKNEGNQRIAVDSFEIAGREKKFGISIVSH